MDSTQHDIIYCQRGSHRNETEKMQEAIQSPHYMNVILSTLHFDEKTGALSPAGTTLSDVIPDSWSALSSCRQNNKSVSKILSSVAPDALTDPIPMLSYTKTSAQIPGQPNSTDWGSVAGWDFSATVGRNGNYGVCINGVMENEAEEGIQLMNA